MASLAKKFPDPCYKRIEMRIKEAIATKKI